MVPEDVDAHNGFVEGWVGGDDHVIVDVLLVVQAVQSLRSPAADMQMQGCMVRRCKSSCMQACVPCSTAQRPAALVQATRACWSATVLPATESCPVDDSKAARTVLVECPPSRLHTPGHTAPPTPGSCTYTGTTHRARGGLMAACGCQPARRPHLQDELEQRAQVLGRGGSHKHVAVAQSQGACHCQAHCCRLASSSCCCQGHLHTHTREPPQCLVKGLQVMGTCAHEVCSRCALVGKRSARDSTCGDSSSWTVVITMSPLIEDSLLQHAQQGEVWPCMELA